MSDDKNPFNSKIVEEWTSRSVLCRIRTTYWCFGGYVQLPESLRDRWPTTQEVNHAFHTLQEITHGPDAEGWIGFHTGSGGDYWDLNEVREHLPAEGQLMAVEVYKIQTKYPELSTFWTLDMLHEHVNVLAIQVAALTQEEYTG